MYMFECLHLYGFNVTFTHVGYITTGSFKGRGMQYILVNCQAWVSHYQPSNIGLGPGADFTKRLKSRFRLKFKTLVLNLSKEC